MPPPPPPYPRGLFFQNLKTKGEDLLSDADTSSCSSFISSQKTIVSAFSLRLTKFSGPNL